MQVEAMGRLDAMLGRSLLHAPDVGEDEAQGQGLWLDADPAAYRPAKSDRDKGGLGRSAGHETARSERGSGRNWRSWYRIPDSNR